MIFTRSQIFLFTILALCCLFHSIDGGKIPKISTKTNGTEITSESIKAEVTAVKTPLKKMENKKSEDDDDDDEDIDNDTEDDDDVDDNDDDDDGDESANAVTKVEKNAVQPAADTSLSVWGIVRSFWDWIKGDISESLFGDDGATSAVGEGRTFGKIRRLQMALIPLMFKFGVLSAMIAFLVMIALKTLFLVKILVGINLLAILAKFFTLKTNFGHLEHVEHVAHPPTWNWTPYVNSGGWQSTAPEHVPSQSHINKEIHLHIHGAGAVQPQVAGYTSVSPAHGWERRNDPYSAYETMALQGQQNEIVPTDLSGNNGAASSNIEQYSVAPQNHRML